MRDLNTIFLVGRLTHDVAVKKLQNGTSVVELSLANNYDDKVTYFECTAFGATADLLATYCKKGSRVGVTGRIFESSYTNQKGTFKKVKINITEVQLLDTKPKDSDDGLFVQGGGLD